MPARIGEQVKSRSFTVGKQAVRELIYSVLDAEDEDEAEAILRLTAPVTYKGLMLDSINADTEGGNYWLGYARYTRFANDNEFTFDTGGGTRHITQSIANVANYAPAGKTAPDFRGAIGVTSDKVEGVDIVVPKYQFTETHTFPDGIVTSDFKFTLRRMTGRWNDSNFKGHAPGECLFMGASGSKRGDEDWSITYRFESEENAVNLSIGGTAEGGYYDYDNDPLITGINKLGWDYMWIRQSDTVDEFAFQIVKQVSSVHIERVYHPGNFLDLNIGV